MTAARPMFLTVALLLTMTLPASAQFTVKGGLNLASFFGDDAGDTESVQGLNLGGSFGLLGIGPVQLLGEVYYRQKGARGGIAGFQQAALQGEEVEVGLDYVEVPLLARIDLGSRGGRFVPYLQGGPAFGWQLDCGVTVVAEGSSETACDDLTENFEETVRDYELGAVVGGGLDMRVLRGMGAVNLDARYTHGLSRIGEGGEALEVRNRAFTVMLGWSFGYGGGGGLR